LEKLKKMPRRKDEAKGYHMTTLQHSIPGGNAPLRDPLAILFERCTTLAERVRERRLSFIDAVDMAYSAADFAGLIESYGDDRIQAVLADAFMGCRDE
jgi:hypothetical protein